MSQIELVFGYTKKIEAILDNEFMARGRGLHTKLNSVEHRLPAALVKKIRWIATIRNNLAHKEGFVVENITDFSSSCESVITELDSISIQGLQPINLQADKPKPPPEKPNPKPRPYSRSRVIYNTTSSGLWIGFMLTLVLGLGLLGWKLYFNDVTHILSFSRLNRIISTAGKSLAASTSSAPVASSTRDVQPPNEVYRDIEDGVFKTILESTKTWLDHQELEDNHDGTYNVHVHLHWEIPTQPVLSVLNTYFWNESGNDLKLGLVDFSKDNKATTYGLIISGQHNIQDNQKHPWSYKLYEYLTSRKISIKVSVGQRSENVTIASGRECSVTCNGVGNDQFQIHFSNKTNPQALMFNTYKAERNPVIIRGLTSEEFKRVKAITTSLELTRLKQP